MQQRTVHADGCPVMDEALSDAFCTCEYRWTELSFEYRGGVPGPCAKAQVRCTLVATDGRRFVGENSCLRSQPACPREPGEDYTKCATICAQPGHAEIMALRAAEGRTLLGAAAYIEGHTYVCASCSEALARAGVSSVYFGPPPPETSGKATNPKDAIASAKLPLHLVPATLKAYAALAFTEGATKYGAYNWRASGVRASVYKSALERHLEKWWNGEWADPVTNVPHLASVIACAGIILDANVANKLTDDRPPAVPLGDLIDGFEAAVRHLITLHADKSPRHWTIGDEVPE